MITIEERVQRARNAYLQALEESVRDLEGFVPGESTKALKWELRAFKKLIFIRLPGGRERFNGHKWKAPKI